MIDWTQYKAGIYRAKTNKIREISNVDTILLKDLIGIDSQKIALVENTQKFIQKQPCNHALLWGARGTGKSSLIKAILNKFSNHSLRLLEISKEDLHDLPEIVDEIRDLNFRFIIYCDDLSFKQDDNSYTKLKPILEGSIEMPPNNILIYATSNRRHLVPEFKVENAGTIVSQGEIHYSDSVEEKISLSDRFGLWLSFYQGNFDLYLKIVDYYFKDYDVDKKILHQDAIAFASLRASRSGRTAKQFFNSYLVNKK